MRIKIVEVGNVSKEKTYFVFTLKYESDGKTQDKKIFSFNGDSYKVLKDATPDQVYDVKLTKDRNGYWQWENVTVATDKAPAASSGTGGGTNSRGFETPEERARRQVLIVRQSCVAQAVATLARGDSPVNLDEITSVAAEFEKWVMRD